MTNFDLLTTVEYGGCSAKLPAGALSELLSSIPLLSSDRVLVDIQTHDDAGVYKLNETTALIVTTDFFPPICSDGYEFGQIAATNSLSDVYAMGGVPLLVLNLNMFPSQEIPLEVLGDILRGGQDKINEAGALTMGGHTIDDAPPKYGLAVVGTVDPKRVITNSGAREGEVIIITKPLGVGVLIAAQRMGLAKDEAYRSALDSMKTLNDLGGALMQKYDVRSATDVTGFGLLGHLLKMAQASGCSMEIETTEIPLFDQVQELLDEGCIPGAAFRNLEYVRDECQFDTEVSLSRKMVLCDAQTSGGLMMCVDQDRATAILDELRASGKHPQSCIIGRVIKQKEKAIYVKK